MTIRKPITVQKINSILRKGGHARADWIIGANGQLKGIPGYRIEEWSVGITITYPWGFGQNEMVSSSHRRTQLEAYRDTIEAAGITCDMTDWPIWKSIMIGDWK